MDAVAEARTGFESALDVWVTDGRTLFKAAKPLGIDVSERIAALSGSVPVESSLSGATVERVRRRRGGGQNGTGARSRVTVTPEMVLEQIQREPQNQTLLAHTFNTTRQTIAKKLASLVESGQATIVEVNGQKMWSASSTPPGDSNRT